MELCVGVTSRLVAEEAAKLQVPQIIASRRQVNADGGYTGLTQRALVQLVSELSGDRTAVVRDHGGPFQNGDVTDRGWEQEFNEDVSAGFTGLHLDVSKLPKTEQVAALQRLVRKYSMPGVKLLIGGERDTQAWLYTLLAAAMATGTQPAYCVIAMGGHTMFDRQTGELISAPEARHITQSYNALGVKSVAHNTDFTDRDKYAAAVDAVNVAPEYGVIETEAWLRAVSPDVASELLKDGYESKRWLRWFPGASGTRYERARCGLRYIWAEVLPDLQKCEWYADAEAYVRQEISDVIAAG